MVIAGTHSGVGKTTIATGLMAALRARGCRVGAAKVGPDFIDPGYHSLAVGRPSRNLDAWMCGPEQIPRVALRAAHDADVLVIEGVMGLFDGAADGTPSSTADVAKMLDAPVIVVIDAASMSQTVAAIVHGMTTFDPQVRVAGLILNRVGSDGHEAMLRAALAGSPIPVVGVLRRDPRLLWRDRHLGLVPVAENAAEVGRSIGLLSALITESCDLDAVLRIARSAPVVAVEVQQTQPPVDNRSPSTVRIALAAGPAFSFMYPDNLDALAVAGAELIPFDPCTDESLPAGVVGLVAGGGFPEVYAAALSSNTPLLADVRERFGRGLRVWAECGGLLWLGRNLDAYPMAGVVPVSAAMTDSLTLGYRGGVTTAQSPLGCAGTALRGHEFHYSATDPAGDALLMTGRHGASTGGFSSLQLLASYLHVHLAGQQRIADAFVAACSPYSGP